MVSGKFRSMLIDIFGRTFPEKFRPDRSRCGYGYKTRGHENVARVGAQLNAMLRNVAVAG